jgi:nucleotide-binding universal stress UspA family protein
MKKTIFVTTDFTTSARNALAYACQLVNGSGITLLLVHVYSMPANYSSDGVVLAAVREAFETAEQRLTEEIEWVLVNYPGIQVEGRATIGGLIESLNDLINEPHPELIIMGAPNDYSDLWEWDSELLSALTSLSVPVLLIPVQIVFKPIHNIGFACDYSTLCQPQQIAVIKRLISYTSARLHVVHIARSKQNEEIRRKNEVMLQKMLSDVQPEYYAIEDRDVIDAVAHFAREYKLDLLMVIPRKHDFWYRIFHQSYTKQLAMLNNLPVMALHEND